MAAHAARENSVARGGTAAALNVPEDGNTRLYTCFLVDAGLDFLCFANAFRQNNNIMLFATVSAGKNRLYNVFINGEILLRYNYGFCTVCNGKA